MSYLGHHVLQGIGVFALSELLVGGVKGHNYADSYQQSLHQKSSEFEIDAARALTERPCSLKSRIFRLSSSVASRLLTTRQGRNIAGQDHDIWQLGFKFSNGSDNHFDIFTRVTIIGAQIITRFLGFDPVQHQRPAALRARRPKIVDELKIQRVHGTA
jgi:hypothetical protein